MKKIISAMLIFGIIFSILTCVPASALAAYSPVSDKGAKYEFDNWDDDWGDGWNNETDWKAYEEFLKWVGWTIQDIKSKQSEPIYVCWYDLNSDGIPELIIDKDNGKNGIDVGNCKHLNKDGERHYITKGNCTFYYWDFERNAMSYLDIKSNNMFVSVWPSAGCIVYSENFYDINESFYYIDMYHKKNPNTFIFQLTYSGGDKVKKATLIDDGTTEQDPEGVLMSISEMFTSSLPLVFSEYSENIPF